MQDLVLTSLVAGNYADCLRQADSYDSLNKEQIRWLAIANFHLGHLLKCEHLLWNAVKEGNRAAYIELAMLRRLGGELTEAQSLLDQAETTSTCAMDFTLFTRELAILRQLQGNLLEARRLFEVAWRSSQQTLPALQSMTAHSLAIYHQSIGNDLQAITYFEYALNGAGAMRRHYILISLARSLIRLRELPRARLALNEAKAVTGGHSHLPLLHYTLGLLERAEGAPAQARVALETSINLSRTIGSAEIEVLARLELNLMTFERGQSIDLHLFTDAATLDVSALTQCKLDFLHGLHLGMIGDPAGHGVLQAAFNRSRGLGFRRDAADMALYVLRHTPEQSDPAGTQGWIDYLQLELADSGVVASRDDLLNDLPAGIQAQLIASASTITAGIPAEAEVQILHIFYFGQPYALLNGKRVSFQMSRSLEILFYLLTNTDRTLAGIQANLFPNHTESRSKNYFHQAKLDLKRALRCVDITYHSGTRQYNVSFQNATVCIDVDRTLTDLGNPENICQAITSVEAVLLSPCEGEWLDATREEYAQKVFDAGMTHIADLLQGNHWHKALAFAEQLLRLDPYHDELTQLLVSERHSIPPYFTLSAQARRVIDHHRLTL